MKITMTLTLPVDNEIQFTDACRAAAEVLDTLASKAIHDGDHEQFRDTEHIVISPDDEDTIGWIKVSK
jgi:hypothetical protein